MKPKKRGNGQGKASSQAEVEAGILHKWDFHLKKQNPGHTNNLDIFSRKDITYAFYDSVLPYLESPKYGLFKLIQQYLLGQAKY